MALSQTVRLNPKKHQCGPQASSKHLQPGLSWACLPFQVNLSWIEGGAHEIDSTSMNVETFTGAYPEALLFPMTFQL